MNHIYLDNNATTFVHPEVFEEMMPFLTTSCGNPSSLHTFGRKAKNALQEARTRVANALNADTSEIIFTSGGTESNNLALKGLALAKKHQGNHIISSKIEHPAVIEALKYLEKNNFNVSYLNVNKNGEIDLEELKGLITKNTILISVMFANNEMGTIQPINEICKIAKKNNIVMHSDAVQGLGKVPIDVKKLDIDLLTVSSHKIHGPKGVGALFIKKGTRIEPQIHGGHQEKNKRTGTENLPGIVGFGKACDLLKQNLESNNSIEKIRDIFEERVKKEIPYITIVANEAKRLPNTSNICFHYAEGEAIALSLDIKGIYVSTGSACSSNTLKSSYVLEALKIPIEHAQGAVRFSFSYENKLDDMDYIIDTLKSQLKRIREMSPLYEDLLESSK